MAYLTYSYAYIVFFFSSRRRHTRSLCDWSSDVCSSDLGGRAREGLQAHARAIRGRVGCVPDLRSEERREGKSVDVGGRRIIKEKKAEKEEMIGDKIGRVADGLCTTMHKRGERREHCRRK